MDSDRRERERLRAFPVAAADQDRRSAVGRLARWRCAVNVDTGEFRALTAEVARLTQATMHLHMLVIATSFDGTGLPAESATRAPRPRRGRPSHLRAVERLVDGGQQ
jgi:hypothetical protein